MSVSQAATAPGPVRVDGAGASAPVRIGSAAVRAADLPHLPQHGRRRLVRSHRLQVSGLRSGHQPGSDVLHGLSFAMEPGERVGLLGRNGAGKTTLLDTLAAQIRPRSGEVEYGGESLVALTPWQVARRGVASVTQGRALFAGMTVEDNLRIGALAHSPGAFAATAVFAAFPWIESRLKDRAGVLSGGQQQQLALARALVGGPGLLLLDEPLAGIQPDVVDQILESLHRISVAWGMSLLLAEQNVDAVMSLCDRVLVMEGGRIVDLETTVQLRRDPARLERHLGL